MKILFKQDEKKSALSKNGITNCHFKHLLPDRNLLDVSPIHHHACFEIHAILKGSQTYEVDGCEYTVKGGDFIILFPYVPHRAVRCETNIEKVGITFNFASGIKARSFLSEADSRMLSNLKFVVSEAQNRTEISAFLIENSILEIIVGVFRMMGQKEDPRPPLAQETAVLNLAKQYINDNIESFPSVSDVAEYCYLSTKQLTRIFNKQIALSPGEYIAKERIARIEKLLIENKLSLREISDRMSFSSEYYFNAFFKKHWGFPPGVYRKMMEK